MNDASFICFLLRECGRMVGAFPELEEEVRFFEIKKMSRSISSRCQCRLYHGARAVVGKSLTTSWQTFYWSNWSPLPPSCGIHILLCLFFCLFVCLQCKVKARLVLDAETQIRKGRSLTVSCLLVVAIHGNAM